MRIILSPATFKESISSIEAASAIREGLKLSLPTADFEEIPVGDGGEGTLEALVLLTGGEIEWFEVTGPLGEPIDAPVALLEGRETVLLELAKVVGITKVPVAKRNPLETTTFGLGELLRKSIERGARRIYIGLGDSSTVDGGIGALMALGVILRGDYGEIVPQGGKALEQIREIDDSLLIKEVEKVEIILLVDVNNPLLGDRGAARIFARQKGAGEEDIERLEKGLENLAKLILTKKGIDIAKVPGGGAAGGVAATFYGLLGAKIVSGIEKFLELVKFKEKIKGSHLVITGEGRMDAQTLWGKAPIGVARAAKKEGIPVIALVGEVEDRVREELGREGIRAILTIQRERIVKESYLGITRDFLKTTAMELGFLLSSLGVCGG